MRSVRTRLGHQIVLGELHSPDLLLWPGVLFDAALHKPLARALEAAGRRVAFVQAPGFGGGTLTQKSFTMEECGGAFLDVADALEIDRPVLGGTSWGGTSAVHAARIGGGRVRGAIAINAPFHRGSTTGFYSHLHKVVRHTPPAVFAMGSITTSLGPQSRLPLGREMVRIMRDSLASAAPEDRAAVTRMVFRERDALFPVLPDIETPVLVLAGEHDALCTVRGAEKAADLLPSGEMVLVRDTGHLSAFEAPEVVSAAIDRFLDTLA